MLPLCAKAVLCPGQFQASLPHPPRLLGILFKKKKSTFWDGFPTFLLPTNPIIIIIASNAAIPNIKTKEIKIKVWI